MTVLAESVDAVIGVDTHRDTLSAAVVTPIGAAVADNEVAASAAGYRTLLEFGGPRCPACVVGPWKVPVATAQGSAHSSASRVSR